MKVVPCQSPHPALYYACTHRKTNTTFIGHPIRHTHGSGLVEHHLAARTDSTATRLLWFHLTKQLWSEVSCSATLYFPLSVPFPVPVIIFCPHVHVNLTHSRHGMSDVKHSPTPFSFSITPSPSDRFHAPVCCLLSTNGALNIISTHQSHLTHRLYILCSVSLFLH